MAVRNAVSAATTTFTAISIIRFFILIHLLYVVLLMAFQRHTGDVTMGTAIPRVISLMSHWFLRPYGSKRFAITCPQRDIPGDA